MSVQYMPFESILYDFDYDGEVPVTFLPENEKLSVDPCSSQVFTSLEPKGSSVDRFSYSKLGGSSRASSYISSIDSSAASSKVSSNTSLDKSNLLNRSSQIQNFIQKTPKGKIIPQDSSTARKHSNAPSQNSRRVEGTKHHLNDYHSKALLAYSYPRDNSKTDKASQHDSDRKKHARDMQVKALNELLGALSGHMGPPTSLMKETSIPEEDEISQISSRSVSNGDVTLSHRSHPSLAKTSSNESQPSSVESNESGQPQKLTPSSGDGLVDNVSNDLNLDLWRNDLDQFMAWSRTAVFPDLLQTFRREVIFADNNSPLARTRTINSASPSGNRYGGDTTSQKAGDGKLSGSGDNPGKRKRGSNEHDMGKPNKQRAGTSSSNGSSDIAKETKLFACHFHKRDAAKFSGPGRYKSCSNGWPGINRLKQHISYAHAPLLYCKRCKCVFKTQDEKDAHIDREERCERRQDSDFDDMIVTDRQREALKKKQTNPPTSDHMHWYQMWTHLFGDREAPQSPYQDSDSTLWSFYQYAQLRAATTVRHYRAEHPEVETPDEVLMECFQFALGHLYSDYTLQMALPQAARDSESEPHTHPGTRTTVTNADRVNDLFQSFLDGNRTNNRHTTDPSVTSTSVFDLALSEPFTHLDADILDPTLDSGYVFLSNASYDDW